MNDFLIIFGWQKLGMGAGEGMGAADAFGEDDGQFEEFYNISNVFMCTSKSFYVNAEDDDINNEDDEKEGENDDRDALAELVNEHGSTSRKPDAQA